MLAWGKDFHAFSTVTYQQRGQLMVVEKNFEHSGDVSFPDIFGKLTGTGHTAFTAHRSIVTGWRQAEV